MACCDDITNDINNAKNQSSVVSNTAANFTINFLSEDSTLWDWQRFLYQLSHGMPVFTTIPGTGKGTPVPAISVPNIGWFINEILGESSQTGFRIWGWVNFNRPGTIMINTPFPFDVNKIRVFLAGVELYTPDDFSVIGSTIKLTYPSDVGDYFRVKIYGD